MSEESCHDPRYSVKLPQATASPAHLILFLGLLNMMSVSSLVASLLLQMVPVTVLLFLCIACGILSYLVSLTGHWWIFLCEQCQPVDYDRVEKP